MKYKILLLLVVALFSVSASFAVLETDVVDSQNDVNAIDEIGGSVVTIYVGCNESSDLVYKSIKEQYIVKEQSKWYQRNFDKLGVSEYLKDHEYYDGSVANLPDDPFPTDNHCDKLILYPRNKGIIASYLLSDYLHVLDSVEKNNLINYTRPYTQEACNALWDYFDKLPYGGNFPDLGNNSNILNTADSWDVSNLKNVDDVNATPVVSAGMESTGLPIAALILAVLVSIVAFRRKE